MNKKKIIQFAVVLTNLFLGLALGWIIGFGFLNLFNNFLIAGIMLLSGLLHVYLWSSYFRKEKQTKKVKNIFLSIQIIILIFFAGVFFYQQFKYQNIPIINHHYEKSFIKLWKAMDEAYPYFDLKGINWQQTYEIYHPLVLDVKNEHEYFVTIARMLGELGDAHSDIVAPYLDEHIYASVKNLGDLAIVNQIGYSAEMAGLRPGMILLGISGKTVEEYYPEINISLNEASTPWARKIRAYSQLLTVPENNNEVLELLVMGEDGREFPLEIKQMIPPDSWVSAYNFESSKPVTFEKLNDEIGYIRVDRLWNQNDDIVKDFDQAVDSLFDMKGIILDLRQNGGGDSRIAEKIAGRFLSDPFTYGQEVFQKRLYRSAWRKIVDHTVSPRGKTYSGKLVVLTDYPVMSSAEWLVGMLVDSGRAISVGRVTGGATGNPITFSLPGGTARYSTAAFYRPEGSLVEGQGYLPDIFITWTVQGYLEGIDPDIQAAINWIETEE